MELTDKKKLAVIISLAVVLVSLGVVALITESFVIDAILHIYLKILYIPLIVYILRKCFRDQITKSMNKALALCTVAFIVDIILDSVRFILSSGVSTVLFLPACLPICFMVIVFYSFKDSGRDKRERKTVFLIGIPLLVIALYFEVLSFIKLG